MPRLKTTPAPLTEKQIEAAALLAAGGSVREVARAVGVHRANLWRWRSNPAFVRACQASRTRALSVAAEALAGAIPAAVASLVKISEDRAAPPQVRYAAAREILSRADIPYRPCEDILERIREDIPIPPHREQVTLDALTDVERETLFRLTRKAHAGTLLRLGWTAQQIADVYPHGGWALDKVTEELGYEVVQAPTPRAPPEPRRPWPTQEEWDAHFSALPDHADDCGPCRMVRAAD